jgi:hypothetical protein
MSIRLVVPILPRKKTSTEELPGISTLAAGKGK